MKEYIEREAFLEQKREQYCKDCDRRKGMRNGKYKTLYEIGEAPCRACEIDDVLNDVEDFPAADVRPVLKAKIVDMRYAEDDGEWKCTHCGWQYTLCVCGKDVTSKIRFCPNCGADMRPTSMSGANGEES